MEEKRRNVNFAVGCIFSSFSSLPLKTVHLVFQMRESERWRERKSIVNAFRVRCKQTFAHENRSKIMMTISTRMESVLNGNGASARTTSTTKVYLRIQKSQKSKEEKRREEQEKHTM